MDETDCNAGDPGLIPELGRSPGEGNGNPIQYFCLQNLMDRGAWRSTAHGVTKSQTHTAECIKTTTVYSECSRKNFVVRETQVNPRQLMTLGKLFNSPEPPSP